MLPVKLMLPVLIFAEFKLPVKFILPTLRLPSPGNATVLAMITSVNTLLAYKLPDIPTPPATVSAPVVRLLAAMVPSKLTLPALLTTKLSAPFRVFMLNTLAINAMGA